VRSETFRTPGPVRLQIQIPAGDVDVQTGAVDETTVELEVGGRDSEQLEQETRIESRPRAEGFEVFVEAGRGRGLGLFRRNGSYRVDVTVPHGAELSADLGSADIRGRGRYSEVDLNVASGDVEVERVEGEAKVDTASGDIEIEYVGSGKVNSASGDVEIDEVAGGLSVNTASGDIDLRSVVEGEIKVNSASGDIEVWIAKGSRLWVDAQSLSGDTSSELELESGAPIESDEGPLVELRAVTMSGDISVRRA
jgi:Putative adhesin